MTDTLNSPCSTTTPHESHLWWAGSAPTDEPARRCPGVRPPMPSPFATKLCKNPNRHGGHTWLDASWPGDDETAGIRRCPGRYPCGIAEPHDTHQWYGKADEYGSDPLDCSGVPERPASQMFSQGWADRMQRTLGDMSAGIHRTLIAEAQRLGVEADPRDAAHVVAARAKVRAAEKRLEQAEAALAARERIAKYGDFDPFPDGTRLQVDLVYPGQSQVYTYLAIRKGGVWFTTGKNGPNMARWAEFVAWLARAESVTAWSLSLGDVEITF